MPARHAGPPAPEQKMTPLDCFILIWIAPALSLIALQPFAATASRQAHDVNISRVGGFAIGPAPPVIIDR